MPPPPALDQAGTETKPLIRGAIRESISTSTDNLFSGEAFSVFVRIQNPFEIPLTIHRVSTFLPHEFIDLNRSDRSNAGAAASGSPAVALAMADGGAPGPMPTTAKTVLQPGNSTMRVFQMSSKRALALKPCMYRLSIEIEYELNSKTNIDTVEHAIPIRASMISMMLGSLIGALLGTVASGGLSKMTSANTWTVLNELVPSLVLAAVSIVLFARKKDVQPIIAIEDFWGGLSIGFLIGYSGPKVLSALFEAPKGAV